MVEAGILRPFWHDKRAQEAHLLTELNIFSTGYLRLNSSANLQGASGVGNNDLTCPTARAFSKQDPALVACLCRRSPQPAGISLIRLVPFTEECILFLFFGQTLTVARRKQKVEQQEKHVYDHQPAPWRPLRPIKPTWWRPPYDAPHCSPGPGEGTERLLRRKRSGMGHAWMPRRRSHGVHPRFLPRTFTRACWEPAQQKEIPWVTK